MGFLDEEPILNPYYVQTRAESENAVCRYCCLPHKRWRDEFLTTTSTCDLSPSQAKAIRECDFAYFAAVMAPFADEHKFRTICDWGNWIFPYDDLFDNGTMRNVPDQAIAAMNMLMASFDASHKHELGSTLHPDMKSIVKLVLFHTRIWHSIELNASLGMRYLMSYRRQILTKQTSDAAIRPQWRNTVRALSPKYSRPLCLGSRP